VHEAIDVGAWSTHDGLDDIVGQSDADHRDGEEHDRSPRPRAEHLDDCNHRGDDDHDRRAAEVGEVPQEVRARARCVPTGPSRDVEVGLGHEGLASDLECKHQDGDEHRERDRQRQTRCTRGTQAIAHEACDAPMAHQLRLHRVRSGVDRTMGRAAGVPVHDLERDGGECRRDDSGEDEHE